MIHGCDLIPEMPPNMGKLRHLRTLSLFTVGSKPGYGLAELYGLRLGGKLHIRGLENVGNESDAKEANLMSKKELNRLLLKLDLCVGGFCVCWSFFEWEMSVEEKSKVVKEEE